MVMPGTIKKKAAPSEQKVWEAALAIPAVPVYFLLYECIYYDGGTVANNSTLDAITEIHHKERKENSGRILASVVEYLLKLSTIMCPLMFPAWETYRSLKMPNVL